MPVDAKWVAKWQARGDAFARIALEKREAAQLTPNLAPTLRRAEAWHWKEAAKAFACAGLFPRAAECDRNRKMLV